MPRRIITGLLLALTPPIAAGCAATSAGHGHARASVAAVAPGTGARTGTGIGTATRAGTGTRIGTGTRAGAGIGGAGASAGRARPAASSAAGTPDPRRAWSAAARPFWASPSLGLPAKGRANAVPGPGGATAFALPMRVVTNGGGTLVFVPVRVNGQGPYEFVLDTGSSSSSVDQSLVRRLGLPRTGHEHRVQGVTGSGTVPIVRVQRWTIGGVSLHGSALAVVDLGMGVSGLLGSDELRHFGTVTLDFTHDRVIFHG